MVNPKTRNIETHPHPDNHRVAKGAQLLRFVIEILPPFADPDSDPDEDRGPEGMMFSFSSS